MSNDNETKAEVWTGKVFTTDGQLSELQNLRERLDEATRKLVREHNIACEQLTERQIANALRQAIECGDFQKFVHKDGASQHVAYIPFQREQELRGRVRELEDRIEQLESPGHIELITLNHRVKIRLLIEVVKQAEHFLEAYCLDGGNRDGEVGKLLDRIKGYKL